MPARDFRPVCLRCYFTPFFTLNECSWSPQAHSLRTGGKFLGVGCTPHVRLQPKYPVASDGNILVRVFLLISVKRKQISKDLQLRLTKVIQGILTAGSKHIQPFHKHLLQDVALSSCGTAGSRRPLLPPAHLQGCPATNKLSSCQQDRKSITSGLPE